MTVSKAATQITWGTGNDTQSVTAGSSNNSDNMTFAGTSFAGMIQLKADNNGTPASGDTVDFEIQFTTGDPDVDPDSSDEYDSNGHGTLLAVLDTNTDDPAIMTVPINVAAKGFRIRATNNAASNGITVSCQLYEASA